jgi:hypothetical protein
VLRVPPEQPTVTSARTTLADLAAYVKQPSWMRDALCREPEYQQLPWVPTQGEDTTVTRAVCGRCAVCDECRAAGIEADEVGIWGGLTGRDRKRLRLARRNTAA